MVWKEGTEVVVLDGDQRGRFGEVVQICQGGLSQRELVACQLSRSPISVSPWVMIEVDALVLLIRPSFLRSYFCRCESALPVIICRTSGELGLMGSLGGKELMVTLAPTVLEVHPWDVRGGEAGYGSKERLNGKE